MEEVVSFINIEDFVKIDVRVGLIESCERIENSEKLLKMQVDFGELGKRQILAGIAKWYSSEELTGIQATFVVNMAPRKLMGLESQGMILAASAEEDSKPMILKPIDTIDNGAKIR